MLLCALAMAGLTCAAAPRAEGPAFGTVQRISRGPFLIQAENAADRAALGRLADEVSGKVQSCLGAAWSPSTGVVTRLVIVREPGRPGGRTSVSCSITNGAVQQQLTLQNWAKIPFEDLVEDLTRLLLDAGLESRRGEDAAAQAPLHGPDWLAVGLAQHLYPEVRTRNGLVVRRLADDQMLPPVREILGWERLPPGRYEDKAVCGLFFAWLSDQPDRIVVFQHVLDRLANGEGVKADWLAKAVIRPADGDLDAAWPAWVRNTERVVQGQRQLSSRLLASLRARLVFTPAELGLPEGADGPGMLNLGDLLDLRSSKRACDAAVGRANELYGMTIGSPGEFGSVVELFCLYLEGLRGHAFGFALKRRLERATRALDELEIAVRAREAYMDAAERKFSAGRSEAVPPDATPAVFDRSEMQKYVDQAEKTYQPEPKPE